MLFPSIAISAYAFSNPNIKTSSPISYTAPIGTQGNPYLIDSIASYNSLIETYKSNSDVFLKLNCDLTETQSEPLNRFAFSGNLDGNNKTIAYLSTPLFSEISGKVSNLSFSLISPSCTTNAYGMLCNELNGTLINCHNNSPSTNLTITSQTTCVGGFAGRNSSSSQIINCTNNCNLTIATNSAIRTGGFLGEANNVLNILNSTNNGNININLTPTSTSTSTSISLYAGGFVGYGSYKSPLNSTTTYNFEKLISCGEITIKSSATSSTYCRIGGILGGATNNTITNFNQSTSSAKLSATNATTNSNYGNHIGGLIGYIHGAENNFANINIENCFTSDSIISTNSSNGQSIVGGLIGFAYTNKDETTNPEVSVKISNSYSTTNISTSEGKTTATTKIGGLVGQSAKTTILNSFTEQNITSQIQSSKFMGGLIGYYYNNTTLPSNPTIINSISNSSFSYKSSSTTYCGGLIGYLNGSSTNLDSTISNCTFKSSATSTTILSTVCKNAIGNLSSLIPNISSDTSNTSINNQNSSFYANWDLDNVWIFVNSLPVLKFTI